MTKDTSDVVARLEQYRAALEKISAIRDSIIGFQNVGWSEHIYPLVAALHEAGFDGIGYDKARENVSTLLAMTKAAEDRALTAERLLAEARAEVVAEQYRHGETGLELEAAKALLKPFADVASYIADTRPGWDHDDFDIGGSLSPLITLKAFRDARASIGGGNG